jgi:hypothetical protein
MTIAAETVNLADRIAAADRAAADARQRVASAQAEITRAVSLGEFSRAAELKDGLAAAQEALVAADAMSATLRSGRDEIQRQRAANDQVIAEAQRRGQAERDLAAARADEGVRVAEMDAATEQVWEAVAEAQKRLRSAQECERAVTAARQAQISARQRLGEWGTTPGPKATKANKVSVLIEWDPLLSHLASWSR